MNLRSSTAADTRGVVRAGEIYPVCVSIVRAADLDWPDPGIGAPLLYLFGFIGSANSAAERQVDATITAKARRDGRCLSRADLRKRSASIGFDGLHRNTAHWGNTGWDVLPNDDSRLSDSTPPAALTELLDRWSRGDRTALDALLGELYQEVHKIAVGQLRSERHLTIQPTALVHEVYLRLAALSHIRLEDRAHFLSMAARVTRQALVDEARRRRAQKRDGGESVTLTDTNLGVVGRAYDAIDVDELLCELQSIDALAAEVVTLRVFGGLSIDEAARSLEISVATVNRRWASGKAWITWQLGVR